MLDTNALMTMILQEESQITKAIATGAGWEIWLQVHLAILLQQQGFQVARELPYPHNPAQKVDLAVGHGNDKFAIELKVESATNSGTGLQSNFLGDIAKISHYPGVRSRWVIYVVYSAYAKNFFNTYHGTHPGTAYQVQGNIGVMIASV